MCPAGDGFRKVSHMQMQVGGVWDTRCYSCTNQTHVHLDTPDGAVLLPRVDHSPRTPVLPLVDGKEEMKDAARTESSDSQNWHSEGNAPRPRAGKKDNVNTTAHVSLHHLIAMYDTIPTTSMCTMEGIVKVHEHAQQRATVWVWVKDSYDTANFETQFGDIYKHSEYTTVVAKRVDMTTLIQKTPFTPAFLKRLTIQNIGNALRLILLFKYGGVYMDLDMFVFKPVPTGFNFLGLQEPIVAPDFDFGGTKKATLNNAFMAFEAPGHSFLWSTMEQFVIKYAPEWGFNGPRRIQQTFVLNYDQRAVKWHSNRTGSISDLTILDSGYTCPIHWRHMEWFWVKQPDYRASDPDGKLRKMSNGRRHAGATRPEYIPPEGCLTMHWWNHRMNLTQQMGQATFKQTPFRHLQTRTCPSIAAAVMVPD